MNRQLSGVIAVGALVVLAIIALTLLPGRSGAQEQVRPTFVPIEVEQGAPTPEDGREVAVLTLVVTSDQEGKLEGIELEAAQVLHSYAPNVLERPGQWTVEVIGANGELRYGVQDPRYLNVYGEPENQEPVEEGQPPHGTELLTNTIWELVVPLYSYGENLEATEINIYDQAGTLVFSTPVDETWRDNVESLEINATPFVPSDSLGPGSSTGVGTVAP